MADDNHKDDAQVSTPSNADVVQALHDLQDVIQKQDETRSKSFDDFAKAQGDQYKETKEFRTTVLLPAVKSAGDSSHPQTVDLSSLESKIDTNNELLQKVVSQQATSTKNSDFNFQLALNIAAVVIGIFIAVKAAMMVKRYMLDVLL
ncbi:Hypothetical protein LCAKO_1p03 (plasmid) [Lacticaseibacillus paracasei subsp. paracasei]|jgi:hypothetical protein|uniref:Uncharacterized protein n=1 Tax=Lacticaseibacillus paracasei subsp. paracasei TaxID=47714 RepID=A0AAP9HKF8_LACPA|nr:hypothetical protein [Lacticaseibacillus paracasei]QGV19705.1 Hypothetical protein LCAKO_1p03 [Lacticaseibacillus paracasei subsp. paracasei]